MPAKNARGKRTRVSRPEVARSGATATPASRIQRLTGDPSFMTSFARGLAVIQAFSGATAHPTAAFLGSQTGLPRAAVHRCLYTLRKLGFVDTDDGRHFCLRPSVLSLGHSYIYSTPLAGAAQPILERVSSVLQESCSVAVLDGIEIVYVARSAVTRIMAVDLRVGSRLPASYTSMGRVLLAHLPSKELNACLSRVVMTRHTDRTVTSREKLLRALRITERNGYALVDQELEIGLRSLAVPVRDPAGRVVAALNAGTHAQRVSIQEMQARFLPALQTAAQELSILLNPWSGLQSYSPPGT
jgi:IclR family pca regulon transcriptional regulator